MDSSQPVGILSESDASEEEEEDVARPFVHVGAGKKIYSNLKRKKDSNDFILLCMCLL
jgi:hypothetical protein